MSENTIRLLLLYGIPNADELRREFVGSLIAKIEQSHQFVVSRESGSYLETAFERWPITPHNRRQRRLVFIFLWAPPFAVVPFGLAFFR